MSVIALTTEGPNPSVVTSNNGFSREGTAILILGADERQLGHDTPDECNATYDLHVGQIFRDHRTENGQELPADGEISLLPGNAVIIETAEWVEFPKTRFGHILPKVGLLQKGIANTPSKIDPGYKGYLLITAFNHGKRTETLKRGERFCSLHVISVEGAVNPYDKPGKRIAGASRQSRWQRRARDWIDANVPTVTVCQTLFTLAALLVAALK
jgi:dCTP deaminase